MEQSPVFFSSENKKSQSITSGEEKLIKDPDVKKQLIKIDEKNGYHRLIVEDITLPGQEFL